MTASTEKPEYVRIYEEIKARQAAYAAANPGKYYLLNDCEMDDIASYHQIEGLRSVAERRRLEGKPPPPRSTAPQKSLREYMEEVIADQAEQLRLKQFEESLDEIVRELNYYTWAKITADLLIATGD